MRHVAPTKPAGPYLITAAPDWWQLDPVNSWKEPLFGGEYGPIWVNPMPAIEVAARLEMRVQAADGSRLTVGESEWCWMGPVCYVPPAIHSIQFSCTSYMQRC